RDSSFGGFLITVGVSLGSFDALTVSADTRFLYFSTTAGNQVKVFERITGTPGYHERTDLAVHTSHPGAVTLSHAGPYLYVASAQDNTISVFRRDPTGGGLTFVQTVRNAAEGVQGLKGVTALAVSADDGFLFATGATDSTLVVFSRDAATGRLTYLQRLR